MNLEPHIKVTNRSKYNVGFLAVSHPFSVLHQNSAVLVLLKTEQTYLIASIANPDSQTEVWKEDVTF